jgi:hypothetical protein
MCEWTVVPPRSYYLVVSLSDSAVNFVREYCHDEYLPSAVLRCGEITTPQWLDRVVREEDKVNACRLDVLCTGHTHSELPPPTH